MEYSEIYGVFRDRLPRRPYCSDDPQVYGLQVRPSELALKKKLIQPNSPDKVSWLIFDIDRAGGAFAWQDAGLPEPTILISNPENGRAHLYYGLKVPVCKTSAARSDPLRYLAAVEAAYADELGADLGYVGLLAKNPFHPDWRTMWHPRLYELGELAEYVDLKKRRAKRSEVPGLGRNCTLFERLREWAYRAVLEHKCNGSSEDRWREIVRAQAERLNVFATPLTSSEVKCLAKSVARWTWREFSLHRFTEIQRARGKRGGRPRTTTRDGEPWAALGVSRPTYYRNLRKMSDVGRAMDR